MPEGKLFFLRRSFMIPSKYRSHWLFPKGAFHQRTNQHMICDILTRGVARVKFRCDTESLEYQIQETALLAWQHYGDVIISTMASQITSVSIIYSTVCSNADHRKHQSSASLAFVRGIHRWPGPVTRKMFPFGDVIMNDVNIFAVTEFLEYY